MEKNSHYLIVGIFVTLSLIGLIGFVIWLAGTHDSRNYDRFTINFSDPVSGLKEGAAVQYRGVQVGNVIGVRLVPTETNLVSVDIKVDENTPIYQSTVASLATLGITGLTYIELSTTGEGRLPPTQAEGEKYPTIVGQGTQLSKLFQDVPAISEQVLKLSEKLNKVFNDENVTALDQTIKNINKLSTDVNSLISEANIAHISTTLENASSASEKMDQLITRFNNTADEIDKAVSSLNSVVTDNRGDIDKFAGSGLRQITEMSRETTEMARAIRRLADRLEQDPSKIIYQPTYRGVEVQK
jgi:phospholipid/cholesterol/gamma-HCH transport system substrate-binding protein